MASAQKADQLIYKPPTAA